MEEEGWRACYGQIEQLAKELEMPSAMLTDRQGWGGRSGQGFHCANMKPLLDRTAHRTRSDKEAFGDPLHQPDRSSLTFYHPYPSPLLGCYLYLNTRAAAILLTASGMYNHGFVDDLEREGMGEGM